MKRAMWLLASMACLLASLAAQTVTVASPNGGESWQIGTPHAITWSSQNPGATKVNLILRNGGGVVGTIKSNVDLSAGSWAWASAGTLENGTVVAAGSGYIVRIRNAGNTFGDNSDAGFTLSPTAPPPGPQPTLQLIAPNGGESWAAGSQQSVSWTAANWSGMVQLNLYQDGVFKGVIASGVAADTGTWTWRAGATDRGTPVGNGFKVKIVRSYPGKAISQKELSDDSDGPFAIPIQNSGIFRRPSARGIPIMAPPVQASGTRSISEGLYLDLETGNVSGSNPALFIMWGSGASYEYLLRGRVPMQGALLGVGADFSYISLIKASMGKNLLFRETELPLGMVVAYSLGDGRLGALKVLDIGDFDGKTHALKVFFITYEKPAAGN